MNLYMGKCGDDDFIYMRLIVDNDSRKENAAGIMRH